MRKISTTSLAVMACFFFLLSALTGAKAQVIPVGPQTAAQLQAKLDNFLLTNDLKGLSASVIIPGKGTWNGVSGISHAGVPIDTAMGFAMSTITHNVTAAATLLLQQDGLLSLTDSLHKFLPPYPNINPNITIRELLRHTSGVNDYFASPGWYNSINSNPFQVMTPQFVLNNFVDAPIATAGSMHFFSRTNYLLLGLIIEQVSGQSYTSFIRQRLLNPLMLSGFYVREHEPAISVMPHHWSPSSPTVPATDLTSTPLTAILGTAPATISLFGTPYDLARWGRLLFTGQVLQNTSLQQMKQFIPVNFGTLTGVGLGLQRYGTGTAQVWGSNGNIRGFSSAFIYSPADSIVVAISSNQPVNPYNLATELLTVARQQLVAAAPGEANGLHDALICFPNPTKGKGDIKYTLRHTQHVEITLQNSLGQTVKTLLSRTRQAGEHSLTVDTSTLPAGMYFCTLQNATSRLVQRWVITQ